MDLAGVPGGGVARGLVTVIGRAGGYLGQPGDEQFAQAGDSSGGLVHAALPRFCRPRRCRAAMARWQGRRGQDRVPAVGCAGGRRE